MSTFTRSTPNWSTASFGHAADTSPLELSALGDHLDRCQGQRGRWFALHCLAEATHGAIAARCVTTLAVIAVVFVVIGAVIGLAA